MAETTPRRQTSMQVQRLFGGHPRLRALTISLGCFISGIPLFVVASGIRIEEGEAAGASDIALGILLLIDLVIGVTAVSVVGVVRGSPTGNLLLIVFGLFSGLAAAAWIIAVVRMGARRSFLLDGLVLGLALLGEVGLLLAEHALLGVRLDDLLQISALFAVFTAVLLLWGRVRGTRYALISALHEQAQAAELAREAEKRERLADIARASAEERSRIARDMHDGISHQLAIVAMHAGPLATRGDLSPAQVRSAAATVQNAAAAAGDMLREALIALREDGRSASDTAPLPASLEALVEDARAQGDQVDLIRVGLPPEEAVSSAAHAVTLARIAEEILLNARKHAPGAPLAFRVEHTGDELHLRARNPLGGAGSSDEGDRDTAGLRRTGAAGFGTGHGLLGVSERAQLLGGHARFGATERGDFEVEVTLPWR